MRDGIVIFYNKDNTIYPVGISEDKLNLLEMILASILEGKPLPVVFDRPMGKLEELNNAEVSNENINS